MATQPHELSQGLSESEKLEAIHLPKGLKRQIVKHLATLHFGEITLCVEKGRVRFVRRGESEQAAS